MGKHARGWARGDKGIPRGGWLMRQDGRSKGRRREGKGHTPSQATIKNSSD